LAVLVSVAVLFIAVLMVEQGCFFLSILTIDQSRVPPCKPNPHCILSQHRDPAACCAPATFLQKKELESDTFLPISLQTTAGWRTKNGTFPTNRKALHDGT
jgi:uncharacterized protein (DUF1499 family)